MFLKEHGLNGPCEGLNRALKLIKSNLEENVTGHLVSLEKALKG